MNRPRPGRRGMILVLVLVVIALLSLSAYTFSELMFCEHRAARASIRMAQSRATAESGLEFARHIVGKDAAEIRDAGGVYSNPEQFQAVLVVEDESADERGRFTVVAPAQVDGVYEGIRYGLENESTRLNLNLLLAADKSGENGGREILMKLPGMTEQIADAILDWIDEDDDIRANGAEREYYSSLEPPYVPRNGMPQTIEELLLVQGVTPELLFGLDTNRNGILDIEEGDASSLGEADNSDGSMNRGWAAYLTIHSAEANLRPDGEARININGSDLQTLYSDLQEALGEEEAKFIILYRQNGPYSSTSSSSGRSGSTSSRTETVPASSATLDFTKKASNSGKLSTVLDLVGAKVRVGQRTISSGEGSTKKSQTITQVASSPFTSDPLTMNSYLPKLLQNVTTSSATTIPGRININQAPRLVLKMIPNMTDEIIDEIISRRHENPIDDSEDRTHEGWVLSEGVVTLTQMKKLLPLVTVGGSVYRAQIIGYYEGRGPTARLEALFDATAQPARVLFLRDTSHLGRGYTQETLGTGL